MQFCEKKLQQGPRISQQILLLLYFCIFQRNFCKNFNLFMDQNSETVQQQLKAFSCRFLMGYVPVSDEKLSFNSTQKLSKSPINSSLCRFFMLFEYHV